MHKEKNQLRVSMKQKRKEIPVNRRGIWDFAIFQQLIALPDYQKHSLVFIYVSYDTEADTRRIIEYSLAQGKCVAVPKVQGNGRMEFYNINGFHELTQGRIGILEPEGRPETIALPAPALMCLPGLAFDKDFYRLGYGGGYYDRYLKRCNDEGISLVTMGLSYENQRVEEVPREPYDYPVDMIMTEQGVYRKKL